MPYSTGAEASACAAQWAQGIGCAQPKPKILFTKAQESQYRPPHTEGVACKQPAVPSDRGLVGHGSSGRFAVVESACRPECKHGNEDTKEPSGGDFAAARQPLRRPRRWPHP